MGKSVGLAAFVLLLISLPIPIVGNYVSLLAVLILCVAAYLGERNWTIAVDLIAWVKMFFLSPTWHLMMFGGGYARAMSADPERSGMVDAGTRSVMQGSTRGLDGMNAPAFLATILILAAPICIMLWRAQVAAEEAGAADA